MDRLDTWWGHCPIPIHKDDIDRGNIPGFVIWIIQRYKGTIREWRGLTRWRDHNIWLAIGVSIKRLTAVPVNRMSTDGNMV